MAEKNAIPPSQYVAMLGYDEASKGWYPASIDPTTGAVIQKTEIGQQDQLTHNQVALLASSAGAKLVVAARSGRSSVIIVNHSSAIEAYLGGSPEVTTGNGLKLPAGAAINIPGGAAVYAINGSNTTGITVSYMEAY